MGQLALSTRRRLGLTQRSVRKKPKPKKVKENYKQKEKLFN